MYLWITDGFCIGCTCRNWTKCPTCHWILYNLCCLLPYELRLTSLTELGSGVLANCRPVKLSIAGNICKCNTCAPSGVQQISGFRQICTKTWGELTPQVSILSENLLLQNKFWFILLQSGVTVCWCVESAGLSWNWVYSWNFPEILIHKFYSVASYYSSFLKLSIHETFLKLPWIQYLCMELSWIHEFSTIIIHANYSWNFPKFVKL